MPNVARSIEVGGGDDFTVVINRADAVASDSFPGAQQTRVRPPRGQLDALLEGRLTSPNRIGAPPPSRDLGADASGSNPGSKLSASEPNSGQLEPAQDSRNALAQPPSSEPATARSLHPVDQLHPAGGRDTGRAFRYRAPRRERSVGGTLARDVPSGRVDNSSGDARSSSQAVI